MSRFAFAAKPKWIFGHLIALAFVVMAVNLGFWQIRRLHERQAFNRQVVANMQAPVSSLDAVLPNGSTFKDVHHELNRRVRVTGKYLVNKEMVITGQASADGIPGVWIVTPLQLGDGRVVLINRGWLPSTGQITTPPTDAKPPTGQVRVTGLVSETQPQAEGESPERNVANQRSFLRIDIKRIAQEFSQPLVPAFVQRSDQAPRDPGPRSPANLEPAPLSNGPHLSYTLQWFVFAGVVVVGYPFLLWIMAKDREGERDAPPIDDDLPEGAFIDDDGIIDMTGADQSTLHR